MDKPQIPSRWIQAHAGSGKTYQLVEHIVRLLVEGEPPASILCMTYTNAAAAEMQGRLQLRLRQLQRMPDMALRALLEEMLKRAPDDAHVDRARGLMITLLDAVPGVQFYTLHGFCQSLLSQFPLEAGVSAGFILLDERTTRELMGKSYQSLLDDALENPDLRRAFQAMQYVARDGAVESLLFEGLKLRREWVRLFSGADASSRLAETIKRYFNVDAIEDVNARIHAHCSQEWRVRAREVAHALMQGSKSEQDVGAPLSKWAEYGDSMHWSMCVESFFTAKGEARKRLYTNAFEKSHPVLAQWLLDEQEWAVRLSLDMAAVTAAELSTALCILMQHLLTRYSAHKEDMRALDYDDLLLKVRDMLADNALRPWVMYKLDQRIRHVLLDEAQDTSPEQWAIIETLRSELWQTHSDDRRSLLVVGDLKQSIYSFQGAVPRLFVEQQALTQDSFHALGVAFEHMALATSRRSAPLLMALVDTVLENPYVRAACVSDVALVPHATVHTGQPGAVTCWPGIRKVVKQSTSPFVPVSDYIFQENTKQLWAKTLADTIAGWVEGKRMLASRGRPVAPGDILILLQTRSMADPIIKALEERRIMVAGLDRLTLSSHLAVRDHLALMEWALHPYDDYHLAIALRSPLGGLDEDALYTIAHNRGERTLWQSLNERMPGHICIERFGVWRRLIHDLSPHLSLQHIHADGFVRHAYAQRFGEEVLEVLDALLGEAARYCDVDGTHARGFASWLAADTSTMKREQEQANGKVRVMTVHGAKGLEAPIVILADAFDKPNLGKESIVFAPFEHGMIPVLRKGEAKTDARVAQAFEARKQAKFEEYYRLLYVALTRAEDEIYVGGIDGNAANPAPDERMHWHAVVSDALRTLGGIEGEQGMVIQHESGHDYVLRSDKQHSAVQRAVALPEWIHTPAAAVNSAQRIYSPSSLVAHASLAGSASAPCDAAERGVIHHRLLQWMQHYAPRDEADLHAWVVREAPHWNASQHEHAVMTLWTLYRSTEYAWLWNAPSYNEVNIAGTIMIAGKPRKFAGQIDKLIMLPECRIVVDYKTSSSVPKPEDIPEAYLMQMLAYKHLLEKDGSGLAVRTCLIYTAVPVLYMLDERLDKLTLPSLDAA